MSDWLENSNGNYVYVLNSDDVMTVYAKSGRCRLAGVKRKKAVFTVFDAIAP